MADKKDHSGPDESDRFIDTSGKLAEKKIRSRAANRAVAGGAAATGIAGNVKDVARATTGAAVAGGTAAAGVASNVGGTASAAGGAAAGIAAAGGGASAAGGAAAGIAVAGGTASAAGGAAAGIAGNVLEVAKSAKNKDVVGVADAAIRGAASGAASVLLTPAGGAAASAVINSKVVRKLSRGVTRLAIAGGVLAVMIPATVAVITVVAVTASATSVLANFGSTSTAVQSVYADACSIVLPDFVEATGTEEDRENGEDVITEAEAQAINDELRSRTYGIAVDIEVSREELEDIQALNCVTSVGDLGINGYVIEGVDLDDIFTDGEVVFPNTDVAIRRALMFVGNAQLACTDGMCLSKCDHLAGKIWGYGNSGYLSANTHWDHAVANGYARPGDTEPPLGALLYWETNHKYGHVATYVGNGMVVSNLTTSPGVSNVYLMPAAQWNKWHKYRGWSAPVFLGRPLSNAGFDR